MAGTRDGGLKTAEQMYSQHGSTYYQDIGRLGGSHKHPDKGFGSNRDFASYYGQIGGITSRRGPKSGSVVASTSQTKQLCTFCEKTGHRAIHCPVRANVHARQAVIAARKQVLREQAEINRAKLQSLAARRGSKRPW